MGKIFVTSDLHFNHKNILKYEPESRPFETIEEMNEELIRRWNSVVGKEDTVYVVGDFFLGKTSDIKPILDRLNGLIYLIRGNHDTEAKINEMLEHNTNVVFCRDLYYFKYKEFFFILCHFPIDNQEFIKLITKDNDEIIFLYGHVHSNAKNITHKNFYHVGVDTNNLTPINLDNIVKELRKRRERKKEND